jgi:predicted nucleic acid-binding Zn ribbon protein
MIMYTYKCRECGCETNELREMEDRDQMPLFDCPDCKVEADRAWFRKMSAPPRINAPGYGKKGEWCK